MFEALKSEYISIFGWMNSIGIIGCGWLGIPLGKTLKQKGHTVFGTRRSETGVRLLSENGINAYQLEVLPNKITGDLSFFDELNTLILSLPPERKKNAPFYDQKIKTLLNHVENSSISRILFLSSTSVYGKNAGKFDETSLTNPDTESSIALCNVEQSLMNHNIPSVIIRLGGLVGEDRNPIIQLQNRKISNPEGCINFIHQIDAVRGIMTLLEETKIDGIYNLVSPHHPQRKKYYTFMAKKLKLPKPEFQDEDAIIRIIKGEKIMTHTGFNYTVNNLLI